MTNWKIHQRGSGRTYRDFAHLIELAHSNPDKRYAYVFVTNHQKILVTKEYPTNITVGSWKNYKSGKFTLCDEVFFDHDLLESILGKCDYSGDGCSLDEEPGFTYCPKCGEKL